MKKLLLTLLFSFFLLISHSVFAGDISDFEIEGISIGDSLLDYMTEDEILKEIEENKDYYSDLNEPDKYLEIYTNKNLQTYASLAFFIKNTPTSEYITNKNEKYKILSVRGMKNYINDSDGCIQKRNEIAEEVSKMFPNTQRYDNSYPHDVDPSGKSIRDDINFIFKSNDLINVICVDFEESLRIKMDWSEGLDIVIRSEEINKWFDDR